MVKKFYIHSNIDNIGEWVMALILMIPIEVLAMLVCVSFIKNEYIKEGILNDFLEPIFIGTAVLSATVLILIAIIILIVGFKVSKHVPIDIFYGHLYEPAESLVYAIDYDKNILFAYEYEDYSKSTKSPSLLKKIFGNTLLKKLTNEKCKRNPKTLDTCTKISNNGPTLVMNFEMQNFSVVENRRGYIVLKTDGIEHGETEKKSKRKTFIITSKYKKYRRLKKFILKNEVQ